MTFSANVERALAGRCIICNRRLPKRKIALYHAFAKSWDRSGGETDAQDVEIAVCGEKCLLRYENGEEAPAS